MANYQMGIETRRELPGERWVAEMKIERDYTDGFRDGFNGELSAVGDRHPVYFQGFEDGVEAFGRFAAPTVNAVHNQTQT